MRSKEDALDYRYFPEPDLPPLKLTDEFIENQRKTLVESAFSRAKRYKEEYNFHKEFITPLISDLEISNYFEKLVKDGIKPKNAAKWIVTILLRYLNDDAISLKEVKFSYDDFKLLLEKEQN
jgi:aspartyl-tRNA(Asn)/glutamyl-tRNA(Gln) amidotransferase subunit B